MKAFGYVAAKNVEHAVALIAEHGGKAKILAGGTDLLVELKHAAHDPQIIVDISRLSELKTIAVADDGLHIGALVTHSDIMRVAGHPRHVSGAGRRRPFHRRGADAQSRHARRQSGHLRAVDGQRPDAGRARGRGDGRQRRAAGGRCR